RKIFGAAVFAKGTRRHLVAPRRAADAEIDAPGKERFEHAKALGDLERAVVLEHDAARAHPDPRGASRHLPDQDLRARARQPRCRVVLGKPVAVIPEAVTDLGELERLVDRVGPPGPRRAPATDRARRAEASS